MRRYDINGTVDGTSLEIDDYLDVHNSADRCVMFTPHKIDDGEVSIDLDGARRLCTELYVSITRAAGRLEPLTRFAKPIKARLDRGDFVRTAGDAICDGCGFEHREHPEARGFPTLHILCDGRLVKL